MNEPVKLVPVNSASASLNTWDLHVEDPMHQTMYRHTLPGYKNPNRNLVFYRLPNYIFNWGKWGAKQATIWGGGPLAGFGTLAGVGVGLNRVLKLESTWPSKNNLWPLATWGSGAVIGFALTTIWILGAIYLFHKGSRCWARFNAKENEVSKDGLSRDIAFAYRELLGTKYVVPGDANESEAAKLRMERITLASKSEKYNIVGDGKEFKGAVKERLDAVIGKMVKIYNGYDGLSTRLKGRDDILGDHELKEKKENALNDENTFGFQKAENVKRRGFKLSNIFCCFSFRKSKPKKATLLTKEEMAKPITVAAVALNEMRELQAKCLNGNGLVGLGKLTKDLNENSMGDEKIKDGINRKLYNAERKFYGKFLTLFDVYTKYVSGIVREERYYDSTKEVLIKASGKTFVDKKNNLRGKMLKLLDSRLKNFEKQILVTSKKED